MVDLTAILQEYWPFVVAAALLLLALIIWRALASRRTKVDISTKDEVGNAKRNQALIDAPPVAASDLAPKIVPSPATPGGDDLSRIKGVGPKLVALLGENGVTSFTQIAAWDDAEIDAIDEKLGRFAGRIRRDSWVEQAAMLAGDDVGAYESKFGRTS